MYDPVNQFIFLLPIFNFNIYGEVFEKYFVENVDIVHPMHAVIATEVDDFRIDEAESKKVMSFTGNKTAKKPNPSEAHVDWEEMYERSERAIKNHAIADAAAKYTSGLIR